MAGFIGKFVIKKVLGETIENKFGKEDPYFETVPATRLDGKPTKSGRVKKQKKALPPGLSEHDAQVLTKVKRRAYRLDSSLFQFAGVKFGWGSVIGLFPAVGDVLDALLAVMVMKTCMQIEGGLPANLRIKMFVNIIFDFVIGLIPLLGDVVDAMYRANTKNAIILEDHLREKGQKNLRQSGLPIPAVDPSDPEEYERAKNSRTPDNRSPLPSRQPSARSARDQRTAQPTPSEPARPAEVRQSGGWFGRSNRDRPQDVEMGRVEDGRTDSRRTKDRRSERRR